MLPLNNWKKIPPLTKVHIEVRQWLRVGGMKKKKSLKQRGSEAVKKFFLMLIPWEKRDSETDSTDLIICGPIQVCNWKEIQKNSNLCATNGYKTSNIFLFIQLTFRYYLENTRIVGKLQRLLTAENIQLYSFHLAFIRRNKTFSSLQW